LKITTYTYTAEKVDVIFSIIEHHSMYICKISLEVITYTYTAEKVDVIFSIIEHQSMYIYFYLIEKCRCIIPGVHLKIAFGISPYRT